MKQIIISIWIALLTLPVFAQQQMQAKVVPFIICQGIQIPIILNTIFNVSYKTLFHCFLHI